MRVDCSQLRHSRHLDFLEIGTSDFDTLAHLYTETAQNASGLSVEPVVTYLRRLPRGGKSSLVLAAVGERDGWAPVFSVNMDSEIGSSLPWWLRGCSHVGSPHYQVQELSVPAGIQDMKIV